MDEAEPKPAIQGLAALRARTRAVIAFERLWPLLVPLFGIVGLFLGIAWLGLFRLMPDIARLALVGLLLLAALAAIWPLHRFRWPAETEIDRRIEGRNALKHAPLLVQSDRLTGAETPFAEALWREHQRRMAERLGGLSGDLPRTGVPARDPWALRGAVALLVVVAFAFSAGPLGGSVADAFRAAPIALPPPPRIDAWVTPPAYTGKPPIFLTADASAAQKVFTVPAGSEATLRIAGGSGSETLSFTTEGVTSDIPPRDKPAADAAPASATAGRQFATKLAADGTLALGGGLGGEIAVWRFAVTPDKPPVIRFAAEPKRAVNGTLELAYTIEDDYGAASAKGIVAQADPAAPNARPLYAAPDLPLALPRRGAKGGAAKTSRDLTVHPWAGVKAKLILEATDAAGQSARSEPKQLVLPEKPFTNPLARALIEQRRLLALDANAKGHVLDMMDAVTLRPEDTFSNMAHFLAVMSARSRLKLAGSDEQLRGVVDYLWEIALGIEDSGLSDAEKRLKEAREALKQALQNGASDEEISKLMKELRAAMDDFMREFAEKAEKNGDQAMQSPQDGQEIRPGDLKKMMDKIEELAKSGARDKAEDLLAELGNMMDNLQAGNKQQGDVESAEQKEMRQKLNKLGEIMRQQQEMMNQTFGLNRKMDGQGEQGDEPQAGNGEQGREGEGGQEQGQQGQSGQGQSRQGKSGKGSQPGSGGKPMTSGEIEQALRDMQSGQGKLQGDLDALMKGLEGMGLQPGEGFGQAGQAMGEAGKSLGEAMGEQAAGEQGRALEALRRGAKNMMDQMKQASSGDQGGGSDGGRQQDADRDPLGRPKATTGPDFGNSVKVPDEIDVQRAREILDAIRKRLGNAMSPDLEKRYLERLLEMR